MTSASTAFKAISDPTRRDILHLLRKEEMTARDLADRFHMTNRQYHITLPCYRPPD